MKRVKSKKRIIGDVLQIMPGDGDVSADPEADGQEAALRAHVTAARRTVDE